MNGKPLLSLIILCLIINNICISVGSDNHDTDTDEVIISETSFGSTNGDGGSSTPLVLLKVNITVSKLEINRSECVLLTIDYYVQEKSKKNINITDFYHPEYLNRNFKIVKVDGKDVTPFYGEIGIGGELNSTERKSKNWTLETSIDIKKGDIRLLDSERRDLGYIDAKSNRKRIYIDPEFRYFYAKDGLRYKLNETNIPIIIKNNIPQINETETQVTINDPLIGDLNNLIYWNVKNPLDVTHFVSAFDEEGNDKLSYVWILEDGHNSSVNFETNKTNSSYKWNLKSDEDYIFKVKARDLEGNYSNVVGVKIFSTYNNKTYDILSIPSWKFYSLNLFLIITVAFLILILFIYSRFKSDLCIIDFIYNFKKWLKKPLVKAIIAIIISTFLFVWFFYSKIKIWHIYSISLAFYELYVFVIIFIIFSYAVEEIFFKEDKNSIKYYLLVINNLFMICILASFYGIISGINHDLYDHLIKYYQTIIQVSGTLLGLILGFYVAQFSNKRRVNKAYLNALEYLVVLYGVLIGLSFWGLSSGATISFTPLIEFNQENLPNIFSIWVFEATLLLIPLAITSLYRLIKVNK